MAGTNRSGGHGVARLKEQYILADHRPTIDTEYLSETTKDQIAALDKDQAAGNEPPSKRVKLKGRNKQRPIVGKKITAADKLCPSIVQDRECTYGDKCKFNHDLKKFLDNKEPDLGPDCFLFETYGKCPCGITCRFAKSHLSEDFKNLTKPEVEKMKKKSDTVANVLTKDIQRLLWKRKYDFSKADAVLHKLVPFANNQKKRTETYHRNKEEEANKQESEKSKDGAQNSAEEKVVPGVGKEETIIESSKSSAEEKVVQAVNQGETSMESSKSSAEEKVVPAVDQGETSMESSKSSAEEKVVPAVNQGETSTESEKSSAEDKEVSAPNPKENGSNAHASNIQVIDSKLDIPIKPVKKVLFSDKLYLAPLTTVGNLPYRRICKRYGADITCGEMAVCTNLLQGQQSEWALLKRHESEDIFGVQLCGGYPDSMTRCAQLICDTMDVDFIDINCGCPIDLIFNKGEGSALMGRQTKFEQIVSGMKSVMNVPLTVKLRTGIYDNKNIAHTIVPHLRDWGVAMTTLHGRSRTQRYTKMADWEYISYCAEMARPMPLFGNGDILSYEDYNLHRDQSAVSGIMIARGALIKPWIFTEIKEQRHWDISSTERFDMLKDYAKYGMDNWGSDQQGIEITRRFLLEWLSFLYRYIPVGILEHVPQQINERPPFYKGRDEMETLMASPNCGDWVKISEMLLGKVPEGFTFLPKHKANAYK